MELKKFLNLVQTIDRWTDTDGASEDQGRAIEEGGKESFTLNVRVGTFALLDSGRHQLGKGLG